MARQLTRFLNSSGLWIKYKDMTCKLMSFSLDFVWSWDGNRQLVEASFLLQAQETCLFISVHQIRDDIPTVIVHQFHSIWGS